MIEPRLFYPMLPELESLLPRHAAVADVGCGVGTQSCYFAQRGHNVTAIDREQTYLDELQQTAKALGITTVRTVTADIAHLEQVVTPHHFDLVLCQRALQLVRPKARAYAAIQTIQAATKPGGYNYLDIYCAAASQQAHYPDKSLFTPEEIGDSYVTAGWAILHSKYHPGISADATGVDSRIELISRKP